MLKHVFQILNSFQHETKSRDADARRGDPLDDVILSTDPRGDCNTNAPLTELDDARDSFSQASSTVNTPHSSCFVSLSTRADNSRYEVADSPEYRELAPSSSVLLVEGSGMRLGRGSLLEVRTEDETEDIEDFLEEAPTGFF